MASKPARASRASWERRSPSRRLLFRDGLQFLMGGWFVFLNFPVRRWLVLLHEEVDERADLRREQSFVGIDRVDSGLVFCQIRFERRQHPLQPSRLEILADKPDRQQRDADTSQH